MPLNPSDLENWINDPEEWVNLEDQENDQWEYEIRVWLFPGDISEKAKCFEALQRTRPGTII
jgi:hypothetical protein